MFPFYWPLDDSQIKIGCSVQNQIEGEPKIVNISQEIKCPTNLSDIRYNCDRQAICLSLLKDK